MSVDFWFRFTVWNEWTLVVFICEWGEEERRRRVKQDSREDETIANTTEVVSPNRWLERRTNRTNCDFEWEFVRSFGRSERKGDIDAIRAVRLLTRQELRFVEIDWAIIEIVWPSSDCHEAKHRSISITEIRSKSVQCPTSSVRPRCHSHLDSVEW